MTQAQRTYANRRETASKRLESNDLTGDIYGEATVYQLMRGIQVEQSLEKLQDVADWFERPNPMGRDPRGESDFLTIRLIPALYACYDLLTDSIKASLRRLYLDRNYFSIYGSENHALMGRVSRYLAAQFYEGETFQQFGMSAREVLDADTAYLHEFLDFRARFGWGEFDSFGYTTEILLILLTLFTYGRDQALVHKARMTMDVIWLDFLADSYGALCGGAHGRIYEGPATDTKYSGMHRLYNYYFGGPYYTPELRPVAIATVSDYMPSDIVYEFDSNRSFPYENRERKHLHSMESWRGEIDHERLKAFTGSIDKYTYLCDDYMLGAVNHQDDYPKEYPDDAGYAHHQQHEWELTLFGGTNHKIFTHHPADPGYHHIHNRWTGDAGCLCGAFYANSNTALAMYDIKRESEYPYINAHVPLAVFDETVLEPKDLFLRYRSLYLALHFDNGYRINQEDEYANRELISEGRKNAVVLRVEPCRKYPDMAAFITASRALPFSFDRQSMTLSFDGIELTYHGNKENGVPNPYPYPNTYDCPYLHSVWGSGVITCEVGGNTVVYDIVHNREEKHRA